ncbi:hypothetical protein [Sideroxydans sp.]
MAEKVAEKKVAKKAESQAAKRKIQFSNPFMLRTLSLNTTPAQLAFDTAFDECAVSLRQLSTVLPAIVKNQSDMMAVKGAVDHLINNALAELRKEAAQIKKIAEDNGIEMGRLKYTSVNQKSAKLTCNKAGQYLQLIIELDELICLVHSAWFAGFIADDVKSSMERKWRRKVISVSAEIGSITNRAFKAHNKSADDAEHEQDVEAGLGDNSSGVDGDEVSPPEKPKRTKKAAAAAQPAEAVVA